MEKTALLGWSSPGLRRLEDVLLSIERDIGLIAAFFPINLDAESGRLAMALKQGDFYQPQFVYRESSAERARNAPMAERLQAIEMTLASIQAVEKERPERFIVGLLLERVRELSLELEIVRTEVGPGVAAAARCLYAFGPEALGAADALAAQWLDEPRVEEERPSDESLCASFGRLASKSGYSISILDRDIASTAAISNDCLVARRGARVSSQEAERLFIHEVEGHLFPRRRAKEQPTPFQIGTRDCNADEEGRAILLEERSRHLSPSRRLSLAVRHSVAQAVRNGSDLDQLALRLVWKNGAGVDLVAREVCRSLRGGGLAREIVYLPAYLRVRRALLKHPEDEDWMALGRISTAAAREFSAFRDRNR